METATASQNIIFQAKLSLSPGRKMAVIVFFKSYHFWRKAFIEHTLTISANLKRDGLPVVEPPLRSSHLYGQPANEVFCPQILANRLCGALSFFRILNQRYRIFFPRNSLIFALLGQKSCE